MTKNAVFSLCYDQCTFFPVYVYSVHIDLSVQLNTLVISWQGAGRHEKGSDSFKEKRNARKK